MLKKALHFIKYNNATVLIVVLVFMIGAGAFASETGQELVGGRETREEGVDNTLLLEADLPNLPMDFSITSVQADEDYYFVKYTYIDLVKTATAWEYQMLEKELKLLKMIEGDLGERITDELSEVRQARIANLADEKEKAQENGAVKRVEVTEYSGLIGKTLDLAGKVIPGYEPVVKREIASPVAPIALRDLKGRDDSDAGASSTPGKADNMSSVYERYVVENDPDGDNVFGASDNCPGVSNPLQEDADGDGTGDACVSQDGSGESPATPESLGTESAQPPAGDALPEAGMVAGEQAAAGADASNLAEDSEPSVEIVEP